MPGSAGLGMHARQGTMWDGGGGNFSGRQDSISGIFWSLLPTASKGLALSCCCRTLSAEETKGKSSTSCTHTKPP